MSVKDDAIPLILKYINQIIGNGAATWQQQDAAVQAYGIMLNQGPTRGKMVPLITSSLSTMLALITHVRAQVRDSVIWVVGRLSESYPELVAVPAMTDIVAYTLSAGFAMEAHVASKACWCTGPLFEAAYGKVTSEVGGPDAPQPQTFALSKFAQPFAVALFKVAARADASEKELGVAACEGLMTLIANVPRDCYPVIQFCAEQAVLRLQAEVAHAASEPNAIINHAKLRASGTAQDVLCGVLAAVARALCKKDALLLAPTLMQTLVVYFGAVKIESSKEDGFMLVGAIVGKLGVDFNAYLPALLPYIGAGVQNLANPETCKVCIGLVGDIVGAMGDSVALYCDEMMAALLAIMKITPLDKSIWSAALSASGDFVIGQ